MQPPLTIVDVGARWGVADRWQSLGTNYRVFGFDPDADECARLNTAAREAHIPVTYVPVALGPEQRAAALHVTVEPACSSLYPPRADLAAGVPELSCITEVAQEVVTLTTLDAWCDDNDVDRVDFIKLDTQGSELGVLEGAARTLKLVQVLEIEVEFNPIYDGQPLFGDVDAYLRSHGFALWKLDNLVHYSAGDGTRDERSPFTLYFDSQPTTTDGQGGQLFWAHAYYARRELCPGETGVVSIEQAERAAAVGRASGLPDVARSALNRSTR